MPKISFFDDKSENNRRRVREHRNRKKVKALHEEKIQKRIKLISEQQTRATNSPHENIAGNSTEKNSGFDASEFQDKLRFWASRHNLSGDAINGLLVILIWAGFSFLPKDSRTFKKTPFNVPIDILTNGKLFYNGIGKCLENILAKAHEHLGTSITLDFNFDGFPISNSSASQFWPILASIRGIFMH